jgi:hypothetical protein
MYKIKTKTKEECKIEDNEFIVTGDSYNIQRPIIEKIEKDINKAFKELQSKDIEDVIKSILKLDLNEQLYVLIHLLDNNYELCGPNYEDTDENNKTIKKIIAHKEFKKYRSPIFTLLKIATDFDISMNFDGEEDNEFAPTKKELKIIEKFEIENNIKIYMEV